MIMEIFNTINTLYYFILIGIVTYLYIAIKQLNSKNNTLVLENEILNEKLKFVHLQLEATQIDLNNNLEFKEKVISIVIHDLKSPIIFLDKITSNLNLKFSQLNQILISERINDLNNCTSHLRFFVEDLLIWLKKSSLNSKLEKETILFNDHFKKYFSIYYDIAEKKNLRIHLLSKNDFIITTNKEIINIIIRNLLDNSIKNTEAGEITINCYHEEQKYVITISDTGIGMDYSKIFELEKGVITNKNSNSSQIGFRIVHDLVRQLDGKIKISSIKGKGSTVKLLLPR